MTDETRLNELLDLVEQARAEGDTATEQKAIAAYKRESQPQSAPYNGSLSLKDRALQIAGSGARALGLAGRTILNTASSVPLAAADFGVGARNLMMGENNPNATQMYNDALNQMGVPEPVGLEKVSDVVGQAVLGSKVPVPQISKPAPSGFSKIDPVRLDILKRGQQQGFAVPPSTTNPTILNRLLESWGGKEGTKQDAMLKNTEAFRRAAQQALGLHPDQAITDDALKAITKEAGAPYKAISTLGEFDATKANLPKEVATSEHLSPLLMGKTRSVDAGELVRAWKQANADARGFYKAYARDANPETLAKAKANEGAARSIDAFIAENLEKLGKGKMLDELKAARKAIAKAYSVDDAMIAPDVISGTKLAGQLAKDKPLSGRLKEAAEFAQEFPQVSKPMLDSGSVRNTDVALAAGAGALSREPATLLYPFTRMAARDFLLSQAGQKMAIPRVLPGTSRMGLSYGLLGGRESLSE